jgi:hypothetical protein
MKYTVRVRYGSGGPGDLGYVAPDWFFGGPEDDPPLHARTFGEPASPDLYFDGLGLSSAIGLLPLEREGKKLEEIVVQLVGGT